MGLLVKTDSRICHMNKVNNLEYASNGLTKSVVSYNHGSLLNRDAIYSPVDLCSLQN